MILSRPN